MDDLALTIMRERLSAGVNMVQELAAEKKVAFSQELFIKGLEVGISLFIQKEQSRRYAK